MSRLFCFGLGYSAEALTRRLRPLGWQIGGTARTHEGTERIAALGVDAFHFDGTAPGAGIPDALAKSTHVLLSAAPDADGDPVLRHHAADIAGAPQIGWIGYLSTIGVYGDSGGAWVDETDTPHPGSERTRRRVVAENDWRAFGVEHGIPTQVFRLGGIYGPGRSAVEDLAAGTARRIIKPGQVFNRIHVDDIANVLHAAMDGRRGSHDLYNVVDDEPGPPQDVVAYAANLMGLAPPPEIPFEQAPLSPMGRSFYSETRRVRNTRLHDDLDVTLLYPSYREGIAAILETRLG